MFLEQLGEGRDRNIERVVAIVLLDPIYFGGRSETLGLLEGLELGLGFGVEGVGERGEGALLSIVEEAALLEQERDILLATHVITHQLADISGSGVGDGVDLDELGTAHVAGLGGSEGASKVDVPFGHEPKESLEGEDGGAPHKCPF